MRLDPELVWGSILGAGALVETWALKTDRPEYTLSHQVRRLATHPIGKVLFGVAVTYVPHWFEHHIVR